MKCCNRYAIDQTRAHKRSHTLFIISLKRKTKAKNRSQSEQINSEKSIKVISAIARPNKKFAVLMEFMGERRTMKMSLYTSMLC